MQNKPRIYLAGPMSGATTWEMEGWRRVAAETLSSIGFGVYDPVTRIGDPVHEIIQNDLRDISSSCGVLAWISHKHRSVGTNMEIFFAGRILRKPVVLWGDIDPASPWHIEHRVAAFELLEASLNFITNNKKIFLAHGS